MVKKIQTRKLNDTSWLAQIIQDRMDEEFNNNGGSIRWNCLHTLHIIVNEADDTNNDNIFYDEYNEKRSIIIREIPSLIKHGYDFDLSGMQCKIRGLAERYTDDNGMYIVSVSTTLDLNTAMIKDVAELMYQMSVK